ncbi:MAG: helix-turn-helix transcriptional regulator [Butyricicoccus sp.]|nr:helix-turn-helix transcriptional regulator [Butyricicoccus sp.]
MPERRTLITINEYGKVRLKLKEILDAREMSRYALSQAVHTRFEVIDKWCNGNVEKLDLDVLARICYVLDCEVSDLLVYKKTEV